jgi:hypothetical protein
MYNQAQFNTTGVNFPAFPTYSGAQNVLMAPTPMVPTPMAQVPMVQAPMAQAPVASSPAAAGSGSPAPMAGSKPNMREFMDATGADFQTASEMLYGVVGSNTDTRDWGAIMSSGNPVTAAAQATGQMYNNPASTAFNLNRSTTDINLLGSDPTKEALRYNNPTGQAGIVQTPEGFAVVSADGIALRGGYGTLEQAQQAGRMFGIGPAQNYAQGGSVKGYRPGGPVDMLYGGAGSDMLMGGAEEDTLTTPPPVAEGPQDAMMAMLERYAPKPVDYSSQIAAATERRAAEQKAFEELLMGQLNAQDSAPQSKAEMYFRLAAAFGAPTKTGNFAENLSLVGETMAEQLSEKAKRERAARDAKLGVQTELQKMRVDAAGGELETLRGLQESETAYGREMARDMLEKYVTSGKPQSEAGKIATDMGLKPGTPEYNAKVEELTQLKIEREMAAINATIASTEAANKRGNQMTATEINLRTETENNLASTEQSLKDIAEAYRLNPNSYAGGFADKGLRALQETAGSDDAIVVNTREIENLLGSQALASLKAIFGGSPTEGEKNILLELQGIGAKSKTERGEIMLRLYEVLQDRKARLTVRLDDIMSGGYKTYEPLPEITDGE